MRHYRPPRLPSKPRIEAAWRPVPDLPDKRKRRLGVKTPGELTHDALQHCAAIAICRRSRTRRRAGRVAEPANPHGGPAARGCVGRRHRPAGRGRARRTAGADRRDREPRRRERRHRRRCGREGCARRLHARDGDDHHARHQRHRQFQAGLRPGEGLHADRHDRRRAVCALGVAEAAGEGCARADRAREIEARRAELFVGRPRQRRASRDRAALEHDRHQAQPHSLSGVRRRR